MTVRKQVIADARVNIIGFLVYVFAVGAEFITYNSELAHLLFAACVITVVPGVGSVLAQLLGRTAGIVPAGHLPEVQRG